MNVDNLASIKYLLFSGFGKVTTHAPSHQAKSAATAHPSFATLLGNAKKLLPHGAGNGASPNLLEDVMAAADPAKSQNAQVALESLNPDTGSTTKPDSKSKAMLALEGTLMTKFVDEMLPKAQGSLYGSGLAGDTWRGFEVDQFGSALSKSDPLQLAEPKTTIKLAANAGVTNLFGDSYNGQPAAHPITPFSS